MVEENYEVIYNIINETSSKAVNDIEIGFDELNVELPDFAVPYVPVPDLKKAEKAIADNSNRISGEELENTIVAELSKVGDRATLESQNSFERTTKKELRTESIQAPEFITRNGERITREQLDDLEFEQARQRIIERTEPLISVPESEEIPVVRETIRENALLNVAQRSGDFLSAVFPDISNAVVQLGEPLDLDIFLQQLEQVNNLTKQIDKFNRGGK